MELWDTGLQVRRTPARLAPQCRLPAMPALGGTELVAVASRQALIPLRASWRGMHLRGLLCPGSIAHGGHAAGALRILARVPSGWWRPA